MAKKGKKEIQNTAVDSTEKALESFEQSLTKTELFIEENKKTLSTVVLAIVIAVGGYYAYEGLVRKPFREEAKQEIRFAQAYFEQGDFENALNGDGIESGFLDVSEEYSGTPAGELAGAYAGIIYAKQGNNEMAMDYLSKYNISSSVVFPVVKTALGDVYVNTEDFSSAITAYDAAMKESKTQLITSSILYKKALTYRAMGEDDKMKTALQSIVDNDDQSAESAKAQKLLAAMM